MTNTKASPFGTTPEVADYLRQPVSTLYAWRAEGRGPRAVRVGKRLLWRWEDVERWLDEQSRDDDAA